MPEEKYKLLMNINGKEELISFNSTCKSCILMQEYRSKIMLEKENIQLKEFKDGYKEIAEERKKIIQYYKTKNAELTNKLERLNCDGNCSDEKQRYKEALKKIVNLFEVSEDSLIFKGTYLSDPYDIAKHSLGVPNE